MFVEEEEHKSNKHKVLRKSLEYEDNQINSKYVIHSENDNMDKLPVLI